MNRETPHRFLLVGNGPYRNRGCEAIIRGTMNILRKEFGDDISVVVGSFGHPETVRKQAMEETDLGITHLPLSVDEWTLESIPTKLWRKRMSLPRPAFFRALSQTDALLEVGGDNYSLDYGLPLRLMNMDIAAGRRDVPTVIWGASIGPFESNATFQPRILNHLRGIPQLMVRETATLNYLSSQNIAENVTLICDPAFLMPPEEPERCEAAIKNIAPDTIGLNFSPLMARYVTGGDKAAWLNRCAEIIVEIGNATKCPILLIPHVTLAGDDDRKLMIEAAEIAATKTSATISVAPDDLNAGQTKWVISQCAVFAGARTHATIAALSSLVPTLSFAYSVKARGINQDIYESQRFCFGADGLEPVAVATSIMELLQNRDGIRAILEQRIPVLCSRALAAGPAIRRVLERGSAL